MTAFKLECPLQGRQLSCIPTFINLILSLPLHLHFEFQLERQSMCLNCSIPMLISLFTSEKTFDRDFLSSIELCILDQTDVFLMQNWEHVEYIMDNLNLEPTKPHDTDFSRIKDWYLNFW